MALGPAKVGAAARVGGAATKATVPPLVAAAQAFGGGAASIQFHLVRNHHTRLAAACNRLARLLPDCMPPLGAR